ncbi:unnamed protein product [Owenia fusiformis]|uniref:Uncharacterized protein n=1 Tax=Owenia fusiformis TaxID=6347 RepID=A0A8J1XIW0_OWEFU|nr:unnamed protein product [Owenia fusiformis]
MASSSIPIDKFRDILICEICMDNLNEPKLLPCQHSFCLCCLETMVRSNHRARFITCPVCREESMLPHGGPKHLRSSFIMNTLLDIARERSINCDKCGDEIKQPSAVCIECTRGFCDRCTKIHKSTRKTESHKMVDLTGDYKTDILSAVQLMNNSSLTRNCRLHPREPLKFLCEVDNMIICLDCHVTSHNGHKCIEIKTAAETYIKKIRNQISPWQQMTSHIQEAFETAESQKKLIIDNTETIKEKVQRDKEAILKTVHKHFDDLTNSIDHHKIEQTEPKDIELNDLGLSKAIADSMLTQLNIITDTTDPIDIVTLGIELTNNEPPIIKPVQIAQKSQMSYQPSEITNGVIKLGKVSIFDDKDHELGSVHRKPRRPPSTYMGTVDIGVKTPKKAFAPKRPPRIIDTVQSPSIHSSKDRSRNSFRESSNKTTNRLAQKVKSDARLYPEIHNYSDDKKYDISPFKDISTHSQFDTSSLKDTSSEADNKTLPRGHVKPTAPPICEDVTPSTRPQVPPRTYQLYDNTYNQEYCGNLI